MRKLGLRGGKQFCPEPHSTEREDQAPTAGHCNARTHASCTRPHQGGEVSRKKGPSRAKLVDAGSLSTTLTRIAVESRGYWDGSPDLARMQAQWAGWAEEGHRQDHRTSSPRHTAAEQHPLPSSKDLRGLQVSS